MTYSVVLVLTWSDQTLCWKRHVALIGVHVILSIERIHPHGRQQFSAVNMACCRSGTPVGTVRSPSCCHAARPSWLAARGPHPSADRWHVQLRRVSCHLPRESVPTGPYGPLHDGGRMRGGCVKLWLWRVSRYAGSLIDDSWNHVAMFIVYSLPRWYRTALSFWTHCS